MSAAPDRPPLDLAAVRARLAARRGPDYWRSLDELAETPEFQEMLHREFPAQASEFTDPVSRRQFWRLIEQMSHSGVTILVTTHYLDEAEHCHRIAIVNAGKLAAMGTSRELKNIFAQRPILEIYSSRPVDVMRAPGASRSSVSGIRSTVPACFAISASLS